MSDGMGPALFDELLASVREGGAILRGRRAADPSPTGADPVRDDLTARITPENTPGNGVAEFTDQDHAARVRACVAALSAALADAHAAGLALELDVEYLREFGKRHGLPMLRATVARPL